MAENEFLQERAGLAAFYRGLADSELEDLLKKQQTLTEPAMQALQAEVDHRGLRNESQEQTRAPQSDSSVVQVGRFRDLPDVLVAKSVLESAGINCQVLDENTVRMDWMWSNLLGGYKLCVLETDREAATQILRDQFPESCI
jgi:Putative prokaryotic signal transducing protein